MNRFNNLEKNLRDMEDMSRVEEMKGCLTYETAAIILEGFFKPARTFRDGKNDYLIEKYSNLLKFEKIYLAQWLSEAQTPVRRLKTDVMTTRRPEHTGITIGHNCYNFHTSEGPDKEIPCSYGIAGSRSTGHTIATMASVCTKDNTAKKKGKEYKAVVFSPQNEYAPTEAMIVTVGSLELTVEPTATKIDELAMVINNLPPESFSKVAQLINPVLPKPKIEGTPTPIGEIGLQGMSKYYVTLERKPVLREIEADYGTAYTGITKYIPGIKTPAYKRIAKNGYFGVPIDGLPVDHPSVCLEAGVKRGDSMIYMGADSNVLSSLRSQFGLKVKGLGYGDQMISVADAKICMFDWVYYPNQITLASGKNFEETMKNTITKFRDMLADYSIGRKIYHVTPLLYYCKEFASVMGCEAVGSYEPKGHVVRDKQVVAGSITLGDLGVDASTEEWTPPRVPIDWQDRLDPKKLGRISDEVMVELSMSGKPPEYTYPFWVCKEFHNPEQWNSFSFAKKMQLHGKGARPMEDSYNLPKSYLTYIGAKHHLLSAIKTYTELSYSQLAHFKIPLKPSIFSYKGVMTYVEDAEGISMGSAAGWLVYYMRETFKNIWGTSHVSSYHYNFCFMRKGAAVADLQYSDEFSACYSPVIVDELENKTKQLLNTMTHQMLDELEDNKRPKGKEKEKPLYDHVVTDIKDDDPFD